MASARAASLAEDSVAVHVREANEQMAKRDWAAALVLLSRAIYLSDQPRAALFRARGLVLEAVHDWASALANYHKALALMDLAGDTAPSGADDGAPRASLALRTANLHSLECERLLRANQAMDALSHARAAVAASPQRGCFHVRLYWAQVACCVAPPASVECLNDAVRCARATGSPGETANVLVLRAMHLRRTERLVEAHADVVAALELDGGHRLARRLAAEWGSAAERYRTLAVRLELTGAAGAAGEALARALQIAPGDARLQMHRASVARRAGRWAEAVEVYRALVDAEQDDARVPPLLRAQALSQLAQTQNSAGCAALASGDLRAALRAFNEALRLCTDCGVLWLNRGDCHRALGDVYLALADYGTALEQADLSERDQRGARVRLAACCEALGVTEMRAGHFADALAEFSRAIGFAPREAQLWALRAQAALALGRHDQVRTDLLEALRLNERCPLACSLAASVFPH